MSTVSELMEEIKYMNTEPDVFKVFVMASDHMAGYEAWVDFRRGHGANTVSYVSCRGNTPEDALDGLRDILTNKFLITQDIMCSR